MPVGAIAGIIGGVASIGGALIGSHASNRAATQAANAQTQNAEQNNALTREIYNRNTGNFTPYMQSGTRANALLDSFIYGQPQGGQPQSFAPSPGGGYPGDPATGNGGATWNGGGNQASGPGGFGYEMPIGSVSDSWSPDSAAGAYGFDSSYTPEGQSYPGQAPGAVTTSASGNALGGWDAFVASPYYQNPLNEGYRALNHGLASTGRLESGDAMKRAIRYGADYGAGRQDEFLNLVGTQANRGFGAASALAGVGQNMVNNVTANNSNAADAISNAALIRAQGTNALVNGIASGIGGIAGTISSYKRGY